MVTIADLQTVLLQIERLRNLVLVQQRGTLYDELAQSYQALTAAQQTQLQNAITTVLTGLKTLVAAVT